MNLARPALAVAVAVALAACLAALPVAVGQALSLNAGDTIQTVLAAQAGKRVTLKLGANDELTGTVKLVSANVVHLTDVAGREFFDAVVDLRRVEAVLVRTKN